MTYDAIVRGGLVVVPELSEPVEADVAIKDGAVAALLDRDHRHRAAREWDVAGRWVLPGAIDPHVHVAWPYLDSRTADDYETATRAAARGGTTAIVDFAIEGRERPLEAVRRRRAQAEGAAVVDFSFHCVVSDASPALLGELAEVVAEGVTSFKLYMTYRRRGIAVDEPTLAAVAARAAELGAVIGVHAEDADIDEAGTARMRAAGLGAARHLPDARPPEAEARAIRRAAKIAARAGARLWILHLSSREGLETALQLRAQVGQPAALETCPQYLLLDRGALERPDGHRFLCSPPLRDAASPPRLWEGLADGEIDWVGTDHCLFLAAQKDARADAFWDCPHGMPGLETRPALILHHGLAHGMGATQLARVLSTNAARWFGLYPRKGTLLPGSDADLAVWDLDAVTRIASRRLTMGGDWTPFEQLSAAPRPELVLVRGQAAVAPEGAELPAGHGRFLARPLPRPATTPEEIA
jgi:dihydropyrimidinase